MTFIKPNPVQYLKVLIVALGLSVFSVPYAADSKTTVDEINQQTKALLHSLKNYSEEQRDEAIQAAGAILEKLDRRISALEKDTVARWDQMDQATRDKSHATLSALRKQRTQVAEGYGSLKTSSVAAWGQMKKGFSDAYENLHEAWNKAEKEFTENK